MFGGQKKQKKSAAQYSVQTMADDLAAASSRGAVVENDGVTLQGGDSRSNTADSPFLQGDATPSSGLVRNDVQPSQAALSAQQNTQKPIVAAQDTASSAQESVQSGTAPSVTYNTTQRSHPFFWALIGGVSVLALIGAGYFLLRSGMVPYSTGTIANVAPEEDGMVAPPVRDATAETAERAVVKRAVVGGGVFSDDRRFEAADVAITVGDTATAMDVVRMLREIADSKSGEVVVNVVTENDAPMQFVAFANRFLPILPTDITRDLTEPFQIYILRDGGAARIAIHTFTTAPVRTRDVLRSMETVLIRAFAPLYLFDVSVTRNAEFDDASHRNVPIRFYSFTSDDRASIDYATHYDHVFFATSRATMYRVMDRVFDHDAAQSIVVPSTDNPTDNDDAWDSEPITQDTDATNDRTGFAP